MNEQLSESENSASRLRPITPDSVSGVMVTAGVGGEVGTEVVREVEGVGGCEVDDASVLGGGACSPESRLDSAAVTSPSVAEVEVGMALRQGNGSKTTPKSNPSFAPP